MGHKSDKDGVWIENGACSILIEPSSEWRNKNKPQLDEIRIIRNKLLLDSDWTQLLDAPLNDSQIKKWSEYRKALRDFPTQVNTDDIIWPTKP